ncbi:MAG: polysaccharide deacetylase family protein [Bacillota bacterium]|nr:polysaccharide deacetylase family protein [Bacillota bacterium]
MIALTAVLAFGIAAHTHGGSGGKTPIAQAKQNIEFLNAIQRIQPGSTPRESEKNSETAVIAFTFDDGYISDYEYAYPILKKYGIRGTSYIIGEYPDRGKPYALFWEQIKEMKAYGWCFGCHTYAHTDLTKMTTAQIQKSMEQEDLAFTRQGLEPPAVHAYPYGRYDQQVIEALKPYRKQMRKASYDEKFVDIDHMNPYEIDSISADMITEKRLASREQLVDRACKEKAVIVFRVHGLYMMKRDDTGAWPVQTDAKLFEKLVGYCVKKGCRFITMEELMGM